MRKINLLALTLMCVCVCALFLRVPGASGRPPQSQAQAQEQSSGLPTEIPVAERAIMKLSFTNAVYKKTELPARYDLLAAAIKRQHPKATFSMRELVVDGSVAGTPRRFKGQEVLVGIQGANSVIKSIVWAYDCNINNSIYKVDLTASEVAVEKISTEGLEPLVVAWTQIRYPKLKDKLEVFRKPTSAYGDVEVVLQDRPVSMVPKKVMVASR